MKIRRRALQGRTISCLYSRIITSDKNIVILFLFVPLPIALYGFNYFLHKHFRSIKILSQLINTTVVWLQNISSLLT